MLYVEDLMLKKKKDLFKIEGRRASFSPSTLNKQLKKKKQKQKVKSDNRITHF